MFFVLKGIDRNDFDRNYGNEWLIMSDMKLILV